MSKCVPGTDSLAGASRGDRSSNAGNVGSDRRRAMGRAERADETRPPPDDLDGRAVRDGVGLLLLGVLGMHRDTEREQAPIAGRTHEARVEVGEMALDSIRRVSGLRSRARLSHI
jgi:hypothetical protein